MDLSTVQPKINSKTHKSHLEFVLSFLLFVVIVFSFIPEVATSYTTNETINTKKNSSQ